MKTSEKQEPCEFKGCTETSCRTFAAVGVIRLCERHFQECLRAAAGLAGEVRGAMGPHSAEFTKKWRRKRTVAEEITTEGMTKEPLAEFLPAVQAEINMAVRDEFSRWIRDKRKNDE